MPKPLSSSTSSEVREEARCGCQHESGRVLDWLDREPVDWVQFVGIA